MSSSVGTLWSRLKRSAFAVPALAVPALAVTALAVLLLAGRAGSLSTQGQSPQAEGADRQRSSSVAPPVAPPVAPITPPPPAPSAPNASPNADALERALNAEQIPSEERLAALGARAVGLRWQAAHSLRVGPIPDYAPVRAVFSHAQLSHLAPEAASTLEVLLPHLHVTDDYDPGEQGPGEAFMEDTMLLWMRDYHPAYVRAPSGEVEAVHFLAHNVNRARFSLRRPLADRSRREPLVHENGNLIVAGRWVFVSERLIEDNTSEETAQHLLDGGYRVRGREEVIQAFARALHVEASQLVVLPNMPHEATGHVDLYLMALNDEQLIIPKVVLPLESLVASLPEQRVARDVRDFLDERAQQLSALGLEVIRLPQLPPLYLQALDEPDGQFDVVFYSPTNGLLVSAQGEQVALLPHFDPAGLRPELGGLSGAYEAYWREALSALGWRPHMVNATHLGRYLGLLHCVTATAPDTPSRDAWRAQRGLSRLRPVRREEARKGERRARPTRGSASGSASGSRGAAPSVTPTTSP